MDRNLGALVVEKNLGPYHYQGLFYYWGSKTPFIQETMYTFNVAKKKFETTTFRTRISMNASISLSYIIAHPDVYSTYSYSYDYESKYMDNVWKSPNWYDKKDEKSLFDPCPQGWIVPKIEAFYNLICSVNRGTYSYGYDFFLNCDGVGEAAWFPAEGHFEYDGLFHTSSSQCEKESSLWGSERRYYKSINQSSKSNGYQQNYSGSAGEQIRCIQE